MRTFTFTLLATTLILIPYKVLAAGETDFVPLVGIPGLDASALTTGEYINTLYILAISVAAFAAVVRLIYAGVQYILSDVVTSKEQAKKDIRNSLLGLLIVIGAVTILETINPNLVQLTAFRDAPKTNSLVQRHETTSCENYRVNAYDGRKECLGDLPEGEVCDRSKSGPYCACNETIRYTSSEPGFECISNISGKAGEDVVCEFEVDPYCPCGQKATQVIAGYAECEDIPDDTIDWIFGNGVLFEEALKNDRNQSYTYNEPALPEYSLEAGEFHGQIISVVGVGEVCLYEDGVTGCQSVKMLLPNSEEQFVPCGFITPKPSICR
ncbi:hypothetical protein CL653_00760 [bacterium]|nr:hypothetical protein [bacterium]|tara:strand:- start:108 stop:1082 length:975 start_codon:yes stop_codon:yes gene_type:complete